MTSTQNAKLFLYTYFFNVDTINQLCEIIISKLNVFNIEVDYITKKISIKIKKTNLKKLDFQFNHDSTFYCKLICPMIYELLCNNSEFITTLAYNNNSKELLPYIFNKDYTTLYFNIITQVDGMFVIQL